MSRAIIEAQRAGYIAGKRAAARGRWTERRQEIAEREAAEQYPITVEQPRVLWTTRPKMRRTNGGPWMRVGTERVEYRVVGGRLEVRNPDAPSQVWREWRDTFKTRRELERMIELFDHPTETVEVR
jgi:hypothetical protein